MSIEFIFNIEVSSCLVFFFFRFSYSIGCSYTNNVMCNSGGVVAIDCNMVLVYSSNTVYTATHTEQIFGKDVNAVRNLHNCRFSGDGVINRISCIRIL